MKAHARLSFGASVPSQKRHRTSFPTKLAGSSYVVVSRRRDDCHQSAVQSSASRRSVLVIPFLASAGAFLIQQLPQPSPVAAEEMIAPAPSPTAQKKAEDEAVLAARVYDATAIGEPMAVGKDKTKVWEKLMNARVVYLGEAEQVPTKDDKVLELEIVKNLKKRCLETERQISLALEAFPSDLQEQLNHFIDQRFGLSRPLFAYCLNSVE